jgi:hypothetical protein
LAGLDQLLKKNAIAGNFHDGRQLKGWRFHSLQAANKLAAEKNKQQNHPASCPDRKTYRQQTLAG